MKILEYLKQHQWENRYTYLTDNGEVDKIWTIIPLPGACWDYEKKIGDKWYNIKYVDTTGRTMIMKRYTSEITGSMAIMDFDASTLTPIENTKTTYLNEDTIFNGTIETVDELVTILKTLGTS